MIGKEKELERLLNIDPISEAEKLTGLYCKDSELVTFLSMDIANNVRSKKNHILRDNTDSTMSTTVSDYIEIIKPIGFEQIMKDPFINKDGVTEYFYVFWNFEHSVMISFDTFAYFDDGSFKDGAPPPNVNGGKMVYNWIPRKNRNLIPSCFSSGGFRGEVWSGDHDCREAIKHKFNNLLKNGIFAKKWTDQPFLWLLHYRDTENENYDYKAITEERISRFPKSVIEAITPNNK